ncbi:MAG: 16S rRNA (cytidine(1402)-2'-O)-methyltransferase [Clostridia bacterium]|nr:16S rRNA (cytidine(1402)-2'-O)-methyltransferase [Clostridia bacterium]MBQ8235119.1 16S rRNA (cytidine(1402)-2'-O)-methyltransferase [Clostridia bacterium]
MSIVSTPEEKNKIVGGTLYLVATPIGNLADLSPRAKKVLSEVDFIAAEDTRNSLKLLSLFDISKPMLSYFEHNQRMRGSQIVSRLKSGESCALITDAGTPAVSDPGQELVKSCIEEGVPVTSVPGCCAAINALVLSGMNTDRFVFEGFLEGNASAKRARLEELSGEARTLILYEAPHRLKETLNLLKDTFGGTRQIALCREMTKLNEEVLRLSIEGAAAYYEENDPRGEYVLILQGKPQQERAFFESMSIEEHVAFYEENGMSRMDAMKAAAKDRGVGKGAIYKQLMKK